MSIKVFADREYPEKRLNYSQEEIQDVLENRNHERNKKARTILRYFDTDKINYNSIIKFINK